jgi:DHA2 family multidrug resistance protein
MGVAGLQTMIDHNVAANLAVLGANVSTGIPLLGERLTTTAIMLATKGMDSAAALRAATSLLARTVIGQSTVIAFDTAFNAVALLFVVAAPLLVVIKIVFSRYEKVRAARPTVRPVANQVRQASPSDVPERLPEPPPKILQRLAEEGERKSA